ncbi:hypothetical protein M885DRAFT_580095, partial [Pelagophyceae sp. CCMP2097]
ALNEGAAEAARNERADEAARNERADKADALITGAAEAYAFAANRLVHHVCPVSGGNARCTAPPAPEPAIWACLHLHLPDRAQHAPELRETAASDALQRVVARLSKENDDLRAQNDTLARNISTFEDAKVRARASICLAVVLEDDALGACARLTSNERAVVAAFAAARCADALSAASLRVLSALLARGASDRLNLPAGPMQGALRLSMLALTGYSLDCLYYALGKCNTPLKCKRLHRRVLIKTAASSGAEVCKFYFTEKSCNNGALFTLRRIVLDSKTYQKIL